MLNPMNKKRAHSYFSSISRQTQIRNRKGGAAETAIVGMIFSLFVLWLLGHVLLWLIGGAPSAANQMAKLDGANANGAATNTDDSDLEKSDGSTDESSGELGMGSDEDGDSDGAVESNDSDQGSFVAQPTIERDSSIGLGSSDYEDGALEESKRFSGKLDTLKFDPSEDTHFQADLKTPKLESTPTTPGDQLAPEMLTGKLSNDAKSTMPTLGSASKGSDSKGSMTKGSATKPGIASLEPTDSSDVALVDPPENVNPKVDTEEKMVSRSVETTPKSFPFRTWISAQGNTANLALVRVEGNNIIVVNEDGKQFSLPFDRFSIDDQNYVTEATK